MNAEDTRVSPRIFDRLIPSFLSSTEAQLKSELISWSGRNSPPWEIDESHWFRKDDLAHILDELQHGDVVVSGSGKSGKSTLLREVAWKLFTENKPIVAWSAKTTLDGQMSDYYTQALEKFQQQLSNPIRNFVHRPILIIDSGDYLFNNSKNEYSQREELLQFLTKVKGIKLLTSMHTDWPATQIDKELKTLLGRRIGTAYIQQL